MDGLDPVSAAAALTPRDFTRDGLRTAKVGQMASKIAAMPLVRAALIEFQHKFARQNGGTVLDGRDIGTVICPEAEVKLFITASDVVRAHRRWLELVDKEPGLKEADVLSGQQERDKRDSERAVSPLRIAADAVVLDTSGMDIDTAVQAAIAAVQAALPAPDRK